MGRHTWIYLFLVLCVPSMASADYWTFTHKNSSSPSPGKYGSAMSACRSYIPSPDATYGLSNQTGAAAWCYRGIYGAYDHVGYVNLVKEAVVPGGQPCEGPVISDAGNITNSSGQCVDFWNADTPSQCKSLAGTTRSKSLYINFDSDGNPQMPPPVNAGGCETSPIDVSHCTMAPKRVFPTGGSIQPTSNKCKIGVTFTGKTIGTAPISPPKSSGPSDNGLCMGECPDIPPAPIDNDTKPCTYAYDGEGRKVCSSSNFNYSPGNSSCGTVNGTFQCVGKAPKTNGIIIDTKITDTTNADGSKTSVKKDTATQIVCNSPKPCVATTTTNTTTITYNSNGAKTGQSTSCTGPACSSDGKGDSDGDGLNDCAIGADCSESNEPGEVGEMPELEEAAEYSDSFSAYYQRLTNAPILSAVTSLSVPEGGTCSVRTYQIEYIGTVSTSSFCDLLSTLLAPLRYVFLAIWAWVAVRTFLSA